MKPQKSWIVPLALCAGFAGALAWGGDDGAGAPSRARTQAASREAPARPPAEAPLREEPAPEGSKAHESCGGECAPAPAGPARPSEGVAPAEPEPAAPTAPLPAQAPSSWIVPLELGWEGALADDPIRRDFAFRPQRPRRGAEPFQARVRDAAGQTLLLTVPVRGLAPRELLEGQEMIVQNDEVLLGLAPVMLRLPELSFPARVELADPAGTLVATLDLIEVEGEVRRRVR